MAGDCLCACYVCLFLRLISEVGPAARVWEVRSEWSKYELVLWILVNYHGLFAPDNGRPDLAKTDSLYVRRKWAQPQALSVNTENTEKQKTQMLWLLSWDRWLSHNQIYAAKAGAGQTSNDGQNPSWYEHWTRLAVDEVKPWLTEMSNLCLLYSMIPLDQILGLPTLQILLAWTWCS